MIGLGFRMRFDSDRDPIVNGFTRLGSGFRGYKRFPRTIAASWNSGDTEGIGSGAGVINATISYIMTQGLTMDWRNVFGGLALGNARIIQKPVGTNGGMVLYVNGAQIGSREDLNQTRTAKLAIDAAGNVRWWLMGDTGNTIAAVGGARGTAYDIVEGTANVKDVGSCSFYGAAASADNSILFANGPANGFVDLYIGNEAKQTIALDATGAGSFDCRWRLFPLDIVFDFQNAAHASQAMIRLPQVFGGDTIGHK